MRGFRSGSDVRLSISTLGHRDVDPQAGADSSDDALTHENFDGAKHYEGFSANLGNDLTGGKGTSANPGQVARYQFPRLSKLCSPSRAASAPAREMRCRTMS